MSRGTAVQRRKEKSANFQIYNAKSFLSNLKMIPDVEAEEKLSASRSQKGFEEVAFLQAT